MYPAIMQQKQEEAADKETEKQWAVVEHTQRGDTSEWIRWTTKDWDPKSSYSPIQILAFESFIKNLRPSATFVLYQRTHYSSIDKP